MTHVYIHVYIHIYLYIYIYVCMYQIISVSSGPNPPETHQSANPVAHPVSGLIFAAPAIAVFSLPADRFQRKPWGFHGGSITLWPSGNYQFTLMIFPFKALMICNLTSMMV